MNDAFRLSREIPVTEPPRASIGARRNPATEAAVLQAAEELLVEGGMAAVTMEAVAKRARAGKATLYRWWPTRGQLLLAVYVASKETLALPDTGNLREDLILYLGQMIGHWRDSPAGAVFRHVIAEAQGEPAVLAAVKAQRAERWHHIRTLLQRAADRGEIAPGVEIAALEDRFAAQAWFWLLTDALPAPEALPAAVDQLLLAARAT